jgi:hypothetical protein
VRAGRWPTAPSGTSCRAARRPVPRSAITAARVARRPAAGRWWSPLARELLARGVLAFPRPGRGYLRGYLSLAHGEAELPQTAVALEEALRALAQRA